MMVAAIALSVHDASAEPQRAAAKSSGDRVIAIDVLLLPDAVMVKKAQAANARLRESYPTGYTLGSEQVPHISLAHAYVRESSLPTIEEAVAKVAKDAKPLRWDLTATGYTYGDWGNLTITTIGIERTRQLDAFQVNVMKAIGWNRVDRGTAAAFSTSRELPKVEPEIVQYVENFVRNSSGKKYHPHVTIGVAHEDFVKRMQAEPFERFTFRVAGLAIYQLGGFGTAQKKLWEWEPRETTRRNK
jgi:2'-5' RNA ligase